MKKILKIAGLILELVNQNLQSQSNLIAEPTPPPQPTEQVTVKIFEGWQTTYIGASRVKYIRGNGIRTVKIIAYGVISLTSIKSGRSTPLDRIQYVESEMKP